MGRRWARLSLSPYTCGAAGVRTRSCTSNLVLTSDLFSLHLHLHVCACVCVQAQPSAPEAFSGGGGAFGGGGALGQEQQEIATRVFSGFGAAPATASAPVFGTSSSVDAGAFGAQAAAPFPAAAFGQPRGGGGTAAAAEALTADASRAVDYSIFFGPPGGPITPTPGMCVI